ncbi:MAG TPA: NADH-quinone oxidoreductase subunit I [Nitrospirota bacterium]|nr:NADH-quinone oxidoreductase subunit I [Nitrospirota bacterium]
MRFSAAVRKVLLFEILQGMALTLRMMFTHAVTRQYPEEKRQPFPGFRGRHALVRDPETMKEKCVACLRCATACPSQCIKIGYEERPDGSREVKSFEIEAVRCLYCAYCVEVCPVCAIVMTEEYEYAAYDRPSFTFNRERLLKNWDDYMRKMKITSYFNKFWRPEGVDVNTMPAAKRTQGPVKVKS